MHSQELEKEVDFGRSVLVKLSQKIVTTFENWLFLHFQMLNSSSTWVSKYFFKKFCGVLRDLVPFEQFKKREKHPWGVLLKSECGKTRTRKTPNMGTFHAVKCLSVPKYAAVRCHKTLLVFTMELFLGKFWIK